MKIKNKKKYLIVQKSNEVEKLILIQANIIKTKKNRSLLIFRDFCKIKTILD